MCVVPGLYDQPVEWLRVAQILSRGMGGGRRRVPDIHVLELPDVVILQKMKLVHTLIVYFESQSKGFQQSRDFVTS